MAQQTSAYGMAVMVSLPFDGAVARTKSELAREGFGVLSEIDVAATLKNKLGVEFPPYVILGACNPQVAHRALTAERDIGLLLPCNVVVYEADTPGASVIAAMDPAAALSLTGNEAIRPIANEVRARLERVLDAVAGTEHGAPPPGVGLD